MTPKVSVVMSVFDGERYLREAVESILGQTFTDFEFIVIDDGSTDSTWEILGSYDDSRIRLMRNQGNIGLTKSLNKGVALARGGYIARMDADDVALPQRLEMQVAFLEDHSEIGILGSWCRMLNANGEDLGLYEMPTDDLRIRWVSLLTNPFAHPTVVLRRALLGKDGPWYDEALETAQDYDLWLRVLECTTGANLNDPLILYRVGCGVTAMGREAQLENSHKIALRTIRKRLPGFEITFEQVKDLATYFFGDSQRASAFDVQRIALAGQYLDMLEAFTNHHLGAVGLRSLRRQEVLRVTNLIFRLPLRPGWLRTAGRLVTIYPALLWLLFGKASKTVGRQIRRRTGGD